MIITDIYPLTQSEQFILTPNEEVREDLVLSKSPQEPITKLTGRVTCGFRPVNNATVKVLDQYYDPVAHTITGEDGTYEFDNILWPGVYKLTATAEGFFTAKTYNFSIQNHTCKMINIILRRNPCADNGVVYGTVTELLTMQPIPQVSITLLDSNSNPVAETFSNTQGQYLFSSIKPNSYIITADKESYCESSIFVYVEKGLLIKTDIVMHATTKMPSGTISGIIQDEYRTLADACIGLYRIENATELFVKTTTTNCEGFYLFTHVSPGRYLIKAKLENGEDYIQEFDL